MVSQGIAGTLDRPLVVLLQERGADQLPEGRLVGEDAHDIGSMWSSLKNRLSTCDDRL